MHIGPLAPWLVGNSCYAIAKDMSVMKSNYVTQCLKIENR